MDAVADNSTLRFSSEALPARSRGTVFRELIGRKVLRLELESVTDRPFQLDLTVHVLPKLTLATISSFGLRSQRTRGLIADGDDDLFLSLNTGGSYLASRGGREVVLREGDAILTSCADPAEFVAPRYARGLGLKFPRAALMPLVGDIDSAIMQVIPRGNAALAMLSGYLGLLGERQAVAPPELRRVVVDHIYDLVAVAIGAERDAAAVAEGRGLRAARLRAVKAEILARLSSPGLTPAAIAISQRISESYLRKLFESEDTSFSQFVLVHRLARVCRQLADPRFVDRTIASLAFAAGFGDLAHFNKSFRRLYGATPSEVRARETGGEFAVRKPPR